MGTILDNVLPGEVLLGECLTPMGLQADYDLEEARERLGDELEPDAQPRAARAISPGKGTHRTTSSASSLAEGISVPTPFTETRRPADAGLSFPAVSGLA